MLTLIYSPYYDGNCYAGNPAKDKCQLGTKHVGNIGLLDELELRAGLSHGETTPLQRVLSYCDAIDSLKDDDYNPFYKDSFQNDPLGVAQQLLRWRDALCMAGWNKDTTLPSSSLSVDGLNRLADLQKIEEQFHDIGMGERWQELLKESRNRQILPSDVSIKVDMKLEYLPPVIRKVLENIRNHDGGTISESEDVKNLGNTPLSCFGSKFTLYSFSEQNDAYQWAALQKKFHADVLINEDNFTFNQVLKSAGKPLVSASVDSGATDLLQLLKLGILLFHSPVNYTNLIKYLGIFRHPIDRETRNNLRYQLEQTGGMGDMKKKDRTIVKIADIIQDDNVFWGMWVYGKNGQVPVNKVSKFCENLQKWAETAAKIAAAEQTLSPMTGTQVHAQLLLLEERANLMVSFLKGKTGKISNDELDKVATIICQSGSVNTDYARLGSYDMLSDLKGLATHVETAIWMDCVSKPRPHYEYAFLNPADIEVLRENGLDIPGAELEMLAADFAERLAVSRAEKIIALMPQRKDGKRTSENLLITELRHKVKDISIEPQELPESIPLDEVDANTQKIEHHVDPKWFENIDKPEMKTTDETASPSATGSLGYKRHHESYSSLDKLINQPFDYVLDYLYDLKEDSTNGLSMIEGNVAHAVINQIVEECQNPDGGVDTEEFIRVCHNEKELSERTDRVIFNIGAQLLQPENEIERTSFKNIFIHKSIPVLIRIIENNHLEIVGSEFEDTIMIHDGEDEVFPLNAKIDMILKRENPETKEDEYLIFDFKWTGNPGKRETEVKDSKELQLALYQQFAEEKGMCPVVMRGYYLLRQAKLLTDYPGLNDNAIKFIPHKNPPDIFAQAVKSYRERMRNLKNGFIEEGEEMEGTEFETTEFIKKYIENPTDYYLDNGLSRYAREKKMKGDAKSTSYGKNRVLKGKIK